MNGDSIGWVCPLCSSSRSRMVESGGTTEWRQDSFMEHLYDVHNIVAGTHGYSVERQRPSFLGWH